MTKQAGYSIISFAIALVLTLTACQRVPSKKTLSVDPGPAAESRPASTPKVVPAGIQWFDGHIDQAFERASRERKPLLLYWGAIWCPSCNQLKASVFTRRDVIEKSKLFVPVYLDADEIRTQQLMDQFKVNGYPTLLVLQPDRTELARLSGGLDLSQYADVLDAVLTKLRPVGQIISSLNSSDALLTLEDCKRLAYTEWIGHDALYKTAQHVGTLMLAAQRCPQQARVERARLTVIATDFLLQDERDKLQGGDPPTPKLAQLLRTQEEVLGEPALNHAVGDILYPSQIYFMAAERAGLGTSSQLRKRWIAFFAVRERDISLTESDQLYALANRLVLVQQQDGRIPRSMEDAAVHRAEAALAKLSNPHARVPMVGAVTAVLNSVGRKERSVEIIESEVKTSPASYHYMEMLASIEEERGNKDKALEWFRRAYIENPGISTRFRAGTDYIESLVRLEGHNEPAIRGAALELISQLNDANLFRGIRASTRIADLDLTLRAWNASANGKHQRTITVIRNRMSEVCEKVPNADSVRLQCDSFLKSKVSG
jgi:thioredoxin-related protein/tetratricopeptide (TPR) repeat protein